MKKAYLNYGTPDQVILWPVKKVDLEAQSVIGEVTIKDLTTGEVKVYEPKPKAERKPTEQELAKQKKAEEAQKQKEEDDKKTLAKPAAKKKAPKPAAKKSVVAKTAVTKKK